VRSSGPSAAPGWYPAPRGKGKRYWDGARWLDVSSYSAASQATWRGEPTGLRLWGWVGALLFTPLGLVIGIVLLVKRYTRDGVKILLATVIAALIWNLVFYVMVLRDDDVASGFVDELYLSRDLPNAVRADRQGRLRNVTCAQTSDNVYRCLGHYKPSFSDLRHSHKNMSRSQLRRVQRQQTGPAMLEVTVSSSGNYLYEFRP
jgi:Protein of unknown function (DUF2510)